MVFLDFFQKGGGKVGCFVAFGLGGCPAKGYAKRQSRLPLGLARSSGP